jgi:hypothetical protein
MSEKVVLTGLQITLPLASPLKSGTLNSSVPTFLTLATGERTLFDPSQTSS